MADPTPHYTDYDSRLGAYAVVVDERVLLATRALPPPQPTSATMAPSSRKKSTTPPTAKTIMAVKVAKKEVKKFFMGAKLGSLLPSASEKRLLVRKLDKWPGNGMKGFAGLNNTREASI